MSPFEIKSDEEFPILSRAPITEAVIELRGRAESAWNEEDITKQLRSRLPDFPKVEAMRTMVTEMRFEPGAAPASRAEDLGWAGLLMRPLDAKKVVQFQRDTFVFSQLAPYLGWDRFLEESMRIWAIHMEVAKPAEIARIGLRFINRIPLSGTNVKIEDYLVAAPREPEGLLLPYLGFLHRDTLAVPGHDYGVQITRTIQATPGEATPSFALIIDLDVFSTKPWSGSTEELKNRLLEMRWLKNKAFFGSLTPQAKDQLA